MAVIASYRNRGAGPLGPPFIAHSATAVQKILMRLHLALLILLFALSPQAWAQIQPPVPERDQVQRLDQILPAIRQAHPGRFYDAQGPFEGGDGRMHYRLKWLTPDDRIIWLDADAQTGAVLRQTHGPADSGTSEERRYAPRPAPPQPPHQGGEGWSGRPPRPRSSRQ